jgi:hypothetical protein
MQALGKFDAGEELAWDPVAAKLANLDAAVAASSGAAPSGKAAMDAGGVARAAVSSRSVQTLQGHVAAAQHGKRVLQQGGGGSSSVSIGGGLRMPPVPISGEGLTATTASRFVRPPSPGARRSSDSLLLLARGSLSGR